MIVKVCLCCVFLTLCYAQLEVNEDCFIDSTQGICKILVDCPQAVQSIRQNVYHNLTRCGFQQYHEIVCCPLDTRASSTTPTPSAPPRPTSRPRPTSPPRPTAPTSSTSQIQNTTPKSDSHLNDKTLRKRPADFECDRMLKILPPPIEYYIVGGEYANDGEFPHMAAIRQLNEFGEDGVPSYNLICGGSLISTRFVLSAAHCRSSVSLTIVSLGFVHTDTLGLAFKHNYNLSRVYIHPEYKSRIKYHDLAVLQLDRPVEITSTIHPACLYTGREVPRNNLIVTGWGVVDPTTHAGSSVLMKAKLSLVSYEDCKSHYEPQRLLPAGLTEDHICASDVDNIRDTCAGDSGGPLQAITKSDGYYRIVGVTSFGKACASSVPGVYTRLLGYLDWIEGIVWPSNVVGLRNKEEK